MITHSHHHPHHTYSINSSTAAINYQTEQPNLQTPIVDYYNCKSKHFCCCCDNIKRETELNFNYSYLINLRHSMNRKKEI